MEEMLDIKKEKSGANLVRIQWRGMTKEMSTWKSYESIQQDLPAMVEKFLEERLSTSDLARKLYEEGRTFAN